ncbi:DUF2459 domain-containing protein [Nostoc sp. 2RC]|uniref:DUF2459 domain-containing protein n=1 Tax=Nostoc sp. 2RC TaxID=2485484 RepID=UPI00162A323A|nr:DUF2459 domain-containing protein [Nostoc sp. 2RC]MBC1238365.1 DUF2459 domain-containing protein [Nostoc sp. 2RC]
MRLRRIVIFILAFVTSIVLVWIFTPKVIIPPTIPQQAIAVYVLDFFWHSELVLPNSNGGLVVYAYGDWNYFALNQHDLKNGLAALFIPTKGTLGRRKFSRIDDLQQMVARKNINLLSFKVAQSKAIQLTQTLDKRFMKNIDTLIENHQLGLNFVRDEENYHILHNSNHELIAWLKDLECQVNGLVLWANFRVQNK